MISAPSRFVTGLRRQLDPPTIFFLLALGASGLFLVLEARGMWFFTDEWAFLTGRSVTGSGEDLGLFEPHNEHWTTIPILVYRALFNVFGLTSYLPYIAVSIGLHLATCALLYLLIRRTDVNPWCASLSVVVLGFACGGGAQNALWAFQIAFLGSAALGLVALVLAGRLDSPQRWAALWLVTVASLMTSGMALPMLAWLGCFLALHRGLRAALLGTLPPAVVYLGWYAAVGHTGNDSQLADLESTIGFVFAGLASIWNQALPFPGIGGVMFLLLVVTALAAPATARTRALAVSGIATCLASYLLLAIARADSGPATTATGRYVYFGLIFTLPAFASLLSVITSAMTGTRVEKAFVFATVAVVFALIGAAQTMHYRESRLAIQMRPQQANGAVALADEGGRFLNEDLDPSWAVVEIDMLLTPDVRNALPSVPLTTNGRLDASVQLQVAAQGQPLTLPFSTGLDTHAVTVGPEKSSCSVLIGGHGAYLAVPPTPSGSQVALVSPAREVEVRMVAGGASSYARTIPLVSGGRTYIGTSSGEDTLRIAIGAGRFTVCRR